MRFFVTVLFLFVSLLTVESQTKRALLVGIGEYPAESGWNVIHGDNDVPLIEDVLIKKGFSLDKIVRLVNSQATKDHILSCLKKLTAEANPHDIIYIHFSTHGQQITDSDGDEEDGLDEAIIPFDARKEFVKGIYEGRNHLIDDELYKLLSALRVKIGNTGTLVVVIDACHSGDSTRGRTDLNDSIVVRGTDEVFKLGTKKNPTRQSAKKIDWVEISATQPYQNNYEFRLNGMYYGSLSYAIKMILPELTDNDDFVSMFKLIQKKREEMNVSRYPQRPMIEGERIYLNQKVF
jgi:hypothetical protein